MVLGQLLKMEEPQKPPLEKFLNQRVVVHVKDGRRLRGVLTEYDGHMNLLLEDAEELSEKGEAINRYRRVLVKGGNVQSIHLNLF